MLQNVESAVIPFLQPIHQNLYSPTDGEVYRYLHMRKVDYKKLKENDRLLKKAYDMLFQREYSLNIFYTWDIVSQQMLS